MGSTAQATPPTTPRAVPYGVLGARVNPASGARPAATKHGFTSVLERQLVHMPSVLHVEFVQQRGVFAPGPLRARPCSANRTIRFAIRSSTLGTDSAGMQSTTVPVGTSRRARASDGRVSPSLVPPGPRVETTSTRGRRERLFDSYPVARGTSRSACRRRRRLAPAGDVPSYSRERTPRLWRNAAVPATSSAGSSHSDSVRVSCVRSSKTSSTCGSGRARPRRAWRGRDRRRRAGDTRAALDQHASGTSPGRARERRHHLRLGRERWRCPPPSGNARGGAGDGAAGDGLAPREEGRAPREKVGLGRRRVVRGRGNIVGDDPGGAPGGARGRRREGASAWRVGGARSALEGGAEGWGSRSGWGRVRRAVAVSVQSKSVGLATPRVGVGPARGIGRPTRARRERRTFGRRLHHVDRRTHASGGVSRESAGAMWARRCGARVPRIARARSVVPRGRDASKIGTEGSRSGRSTPSGRACFAPTG